MRFCEREETSLRAVQVGLLPNRSSYKALASKFYDDFEVDDGEIEEFSFFESDFDSDDIEDESFIIDL